MKKSFYLLLFSLALFSCQSNEKIAIEKLEEQIIKYAHDPDSYEFDSMESVDTILISDSIKISISSDLINLESNKRYIELFKNDSINLAVEKGIYKSYIRRIEEKNNYLDKLNKNLEEDKILHISYKMIFRIKNGLGALIREQALIKYFPDTETWGDVDIM